MSGKSCKTFLHQILINLKFWSHCIEMLTLGLQIRIDFVDTELLTPTDGNCVDQVKYFKIFLSKNYIITVLISSTWSYPDQFGQLESKKFAESIPISIFMSTWMIRLPLSISILPSLRSDRINLINLVSHYFYIHYTMEFLTELPWLYLIAK